MRFIFLLLLLAFFSHAKELSLKTMKNEQRFAFVIENSSYEGLPVNAALQKTHQIDSFLRDSGFQTIYFKDATRNEMIKGLRTFKLVIENGGVVLFYYVGHALQVDNKNYLLPVDALTNKQWSGEKMLELDGILNVMNRYKSRLNIVVIDSVDSPALRKEFKAEKKGLAKIHVLENTDLIVSSKLNSSSRNADFNKHLCNVLSHKGVSNEDGIKKYKQKDDKPYIRLSKEEFYFRLPKKLMSKEEKAWSKTLALGTVGAFSLYLKAYPNGKYLSQAKNNLEMIKVKQLNILKQKEQRVALKKEQKVAFEKEQVKREEELRIKRKQEEKRKKEAEAKAISDAKQKVAVASKEKIDKNAFYIEPEMVKINAGSFRMGSSLYKIKNEMPAHYVDIKNDFYIGKYEVSNAEYKAFLQATRPNAKQLKENLIDNEPATDVSWEDAVAYASWLSILSGKKYRLPKESEWEYLARAGSKTRFFWGNTDVSHKKAYWLKGKPNNAHRYAWIETNSEGKIHSVGLKQENPWGIYDINGNVSEWCADSYTPDYAQENQDKELKVIRGGSYLSTPKEITTSCRSSKKDTYKNKDLGFRLLKEM